VGRDNRVAILEMATETELQLIDLNTAPQLLTDREGELIFSVLWSYVDVIKYIEQKIYTRSGQKLWGSVHIVSWA
jgi:hypothetical protein